MAQAEQLNFVVLNSAGDGQYNIAAYRSGREVRMTCECEAGANGQHCKHRLALLWGDVTALSSANPGDVATLNTWLSGTPLEAALSEVAALEREAEVVRKRLSQAKKRLGKVLLTGTPP